MRLQEFIALVTGSICLIAIFVGCDRDVPTAGATDAQVDPISRQFFPYQLDEFEIVSVDVIHGLSGRFGSLRYRRRESERLDRASIETRIVRALQADGWQAAPLPDYEPMSKNHPLSAHDLWFERGAFTADDDIHAYRQRIHISDDGGGLVVYWEAYWS